MYFANRPTGVLFSIINDRCIENVLKLSAQREDTHIRLCGRPAIQPLGSFIILHLRSVIPRYEGLACPGLAVQLHRLLPSNYSI